jgi:Fibronectin type III domain
MLASKLRAAVRLLAVAALFGFAASAASADTVPLPSAAVAANGYSLTSTSCPAAGACVAVGSYTDSSINLQALIETQSGGVWSASTVDLSPIPPATNDSNPQLTSVSCTAVGDCVAVGNFYDALGPEGLIETEKNGTWTAAKLNLSSLPSVNGIPNVSLTSVSCPSTGNCAAVGNYVDAAGNQQGLLASERNGTWTAAEADVSSIGGASQPATTLVQVSCASAGNCAAVGNYSDAAGDILPVIETESGGTWGAGVPDMSQLPSVASAGTQDALLQSVSCPSAGNCAAVGSYVDGTANGGSLQGMMLAETNGTWSPAAEAPLPGDAYTTGGGSGNPAQADLTLAAVSCASAGNCTAVGSYDATAADNVEPLELTETGGAWATGSAVSVPSGAAANPEAWLDSVLCSAPGTCVASGTDEASDGDNAVLIARQSAGNWSTVASEQTSNYSYFEVNETTISCAPDGYCATAGNVADITANTSAFLLDAPGTVQSPRAADSGKDAAALTWGNPGNDQFDPPVDGYTVTIHDLTDARHGSQTITGPSARNLTVTGLTPGDGYAFTISATSILGTGLTSTSGVVTVGLTRRQIWASLLRLLAPRGAASRLKRLQRTHSYTFRYRPIESDKVSVRWFQTTGHGKHRHRHRVASGSVVAKGVKAVNVRVRLTAFGRRAVNSAGRLRLIAIVTFKSGGTTVTRTRSFMLH